MSVAPKLRKPFGPRLSIQGNTLITSHVLMYLGSKNLRWVRWVSQVFDFLYTLHESGAIGAHEKASCAIVSDSVYEMNLHFINRVTYYCTNCFLVCPNSSWFMQCVQEIKNLTYSWLVGIRLPSAAEV